MVIMIIINNGKNNYTASPSWAKKHLPISPNSVYRKLQS